MAQRNKVSEQQYYQQVEQKLFDVADSIIAYMESDITIPVDTHNLKDGLGVAVFLPPARLERFHINPRAVVPRTNIGLAGFERGDVWGRELIHKVMEDGMSKYSDGYYIVLYSSMPYDVIQDSSGPNAGFFSIGLSNEFIREVMIAVNILNIEKN